MGSVFIPRAEAQRRRAIFIVLLAVVLLIGCSLDNETGGLNGYWSDGFGHITISSSLKTIIYDSGFGFAYIGEIVNDPDYTATTGVLIIKFIDYKDWSGEDVSANINKFGALYWNNLTINSVLMSDANTDGGFTHVIIDTFEEAQIAFTMDKAGDYVDWSILGAYTK